jgi:hypothetical protein
MDTAVTDWLPCMRFPGRDVPTLILGVRDRFGEGAAVAVQNYISSAECKTLHKGSNCQQIWQRYNEKTVSSSGELLPSVWKTQLGQMGITEVIFVHVLGENVP